MKIITIFPQIPSLKETTKPSSEQTFLVAEKPKVALCRPPGPLRLAVVGLLPPGGHSWYRSQRGRPSRSEQPQQRDPQSVTLIMLQLSSLITWEDQEPARFIMGLWCLLIHNSIVFDRQPKIKANKGLWNVDSIILLA